MATTGAQDLQRFLDAQRPVFAGVCAELETGRKTSHWMWFIFPQLVQLGRSATARHFGIRDRAEALAYWRHPVLGQRLLHCTGLMLATRGRTAHEVLGTPDDLKFRSCMTLFAGVASEVPGFRAALLQFFGGEPDPRTLELLQSMA